mmetsp:Transcript_74500/g.112262  ORF Transcript_74500/g.112262 Transcript_74500/m.112262 type:complete len:279 (+) Transcript_74500:106-942(+)
MSSDDDEGEVGSRSIQDLAFDSFGVLEHVLSYVEASDLLSATRVNRRWKEAGRNDELWEAAIPLLWQGKVGVPVEQTLFWRSLFSKEAWQRMSMTQIRSIFDHPLLTEKKELLRNCTGKQELQRFLQVHMLDIMSDVSECYRFFADIYFGSYACSVLDSKRDLITPLELCTPHGFDMFFKIAEEEVDEADRSFLTRYEAQDGVLLYHHSTCHFEESRDFQIVLRENVHSYHPTDLKWRWLDVGKRIQVGPYPPLNSVRRKDWGWNLENQHVVLLFRDK